MSRTPKTIPSGPFKGMKIECAPTSGIDMFQPIAEDFMKRIVGLDYEECLVTDESSIYDFTDFTEAELCRRILDAYALDISKIKTRNLLDIFRRIHTRERADTE